MKTLNLLDYFGAAKFINLDCHSDSADAATMAHEHWQNRQSLMKTRFAQAGITGVTRQRGITGDKNPPPSWFHGGGGGSNGAWGCLMSHLRLAQDCAEDDVESYVVFEDDAIFADNFTKVLPEALKEIGEDWDMLYLGGQHLIEDGWPWREKDKQHVVRAFNVNRTHAFAVNGRFLKKFTQHILHAPDYAGRTWHIDHQLGNLHTWGRFKIYAVDPWIVGQGAGKSHINGHWISEDEWWFRNPTHLNPNLNLGQPIR
jgi:hypothetical protein